MNIAVLCGSLSSEPTTRTLPSGTTLLGFSITTPGSPAISVPVAWFDAPDVNWKVGTQLLVRGSIVRRFYRGAAGMQSRTEVVATEVVATTRRKQAAKSVDKAMAELAGGWEEPGV